MRRGSTPTRVNSSRTASARRFASATLAARWPLASAKPVMVIMVPMPITAADAWRTALTASASSVAEPSANLTVAAGRIPRAAFASGASGIAGAAVRACGGGVGAT